MFVLYFTGFVHLLVLNFLFLFDAEEIWKDYRQKYSRMINYVLLSIHKFAEF